MSNPYVTEHCDHRDDCNNTGCRCLAPVAAIDAADVAYRDPVQCTRYKGASCEEGGKAVVLIGLWKKRSR